MLRSRISIASGFASELGLLAAASTLALLLAGCSSSDQESATVGYPGPGSPNGGSNVNLGGAEDCGYFRAQLAAGQVPMPGDCDSAGFFAEHYTALPAPTCGQRVCLQAMLGVMPNLLDGSNCTMLDVGLNSPIEADPLSRPPLTLAVVVDVSGSMNEENKIGFVRDGLGKLVDGLLDGDRFALITYSDQVQVRFPMQDITLHRAELHTIAASLVAGGSTNFYAGLEAGYKEVFANYDSGRQNRVIMMSDGEPTSGVTDTQAIIDMSRSYNSEGVGLTTIGLGTSFNVELMRNLALQADGNFYFLENSGAVDEVFTEELSYFTVPIAYDLTLDFKTGTQYAFGQAYGSPLWQNTSYGGRLDVPSVFLAQRQSASDVTVAGGRRGGGSALLIKVAPNLTADDGSGIASADVATIDIQFREPGTDLILSDTVTVNFPYPPWMLPTSGYFQSPDVTLIQKPFVMLNIFLGIDRAVTTFHKIGRTQAEGSESIAELDRLIAAVKDYNAGINAGAGDTDFNYDLVLLDELRTVLIANGLISPTDSKIPADPWPAN